MVKRCFQVSIYIDPGKKTFHGKTNLRFETLGVGPKIELKTKVFVFFPLLKGQKPTLSQAHEAGNNELIWNNLVERWTDLWNRARGLGQSWTRPAVAAPGRAGSTLGFNQESGPTLTQTKGSLSIEPVHTGLVSGLAQILIRAELSPSRAISVNILQLR